MDEGRRKFEFKLNGNLIQVCGISPQCSLLEYLRNLGLTGSKEGCGEGECGACSVLLVGNGPLGTRYLPVNSCLIGLPMIAGQEVITVEGLASRGTLSEVQRAMAENGGSQCGYCTPGFVISMFAEQHRRENRPVSMDALTGNLCRCTGYRPIRDALLSLGPAPEGPHRARLERPAPEPVPIQYVTDIAKFSRPKTLDECLELLARDPAARLVAGNTDLGVMASLNGERFSHLIAVDALKELRTFQDTEKLVEIGCGLSLFEISEIWTNAPPAVQEWFKLFGSPQIRNRATIGGNIATASPIADSAPLLLAFDAEVVVATPAGQHKLPLNRFFRGYRSTALNHDEVLVAIQIPKPFPNQMRFYKAAKRLYNDISTATAAIALWRNGNGAISKARIALGGVAPMPVRARAAEAALIGKLGSENDFDCARQSITLDVTPISDHRGSAKFRLALVQNLLLKFQLELSEGADT